MNNIQSDLFDGILGLQLCSFNSVKEVYVRANRLMVTLDARSPSFDGEYTFLRRQPKFSEVSDGGGKAYFFFGLR